MAKTKDTVVIKKNGVEKTIATAQWNAMKANNSTYGWRLASDLPDDVKDVDKKLETSKIAELETNVKTLTEENTKLKEEVIALELSVKNKDLKIAELEAKVVELTPKTKANAKGAN